MPDASAFVEDTNSNESFHTPSMMGKDSDQWFNDSQISIATKPNKVESPSSEETPPIIPILPPVLIERVSRNPQKMPRIWAGNDGTSDDIPQDLFIESTDPKPKNPPW
jgi:hypothetical protein